jgi:hypothetical protein
MPACWRLGAWCGWLQVSELEAMRKREEVNLKALQKEHSQLKKEQFRASQALHALRQVRCSGHTPLMVQRRRRASTRQAKVHSPQLTRLPDACLCVFCPQAEKELISDIAGGQGQAKNLAARQKALDEQLQRQGELMYAVDFSLQVRLAAAHPWQRIAEHAGVAVFLRAITSRACTALCSLSAALRPKLANHTLVACLPALSCCLQEMEHRIARAGGYRSDDEARALNARIADLSKLLETVSSEHAMLTTQVSL